MKWTFTDSNRRIMKNNIKQQPKKAKYVLSMSLDASNMDKYSRSALISQVSNDVDYNICQGL